MKAKKETEDNIQSALLKDDQHLARAKRERVDSRNVKLSYFDQNGSEIFSFLDKCKK